MTEEALRRWFGEHVSRMDELKERMGQKRRELAAQTSVREQKRSAEEGKRYGAQEEWKREEMRRFRPQTTRDRDK